jgi:predicted ATPase
LYGQWFTAEIQGEHRVALALADQMLEIARGVGGSGPLTIGHYAQAVTRHYLGDLAGAGQHFQRPIDHSRDAELRDIPVDLRVFVLSISGRNEWHLGHPDQARRGVADAIALARRLNNSFSVAWAAIGALLVSMFCRDFKGVLVACDELLRVNTAMGFPPFNAMTTIWSAWARAQMGEVGGAVERIRQGLAELDAMKWSLGLNVFLMMLGETQGLAGAIHHALVTVEQALRTGSEELIYRPAVLLVRGELQLRKDSGSKAQLEAAEQDFREAIALARDMGAKSSELRATTSVARLLAKQGHRGEARTMLAEIYNWFTEGFDTADLKDAKALLDELRTSHSSLRSGPSLRHGALPRTLPLAWRQL